MSGQCHHAKLQAVQALGAVQVRTWRPARGCSAGGDGGDRGGPCRRHGDLRLELVEGGGGGECPLNRRPQVRCHGARVRAHDLRRQANTTVKEHTRGSRTQCADGLSMLCSHDSILARKRITLPGNWPMLVQIPTQLLYAWPLLHVAIVVCLVDRTRQVRFKKGAK